MKQNARFYRVMQSIAIALLTAVLISCVGYRPQLGMTYEEWQNHWAVSDQGEYPPKMVGAKAGMEVWTLEDGVFLYFQNGRLVQMDQGELLTQKIQVEVISQ